MSETQSKTNTKREQPIMLKVKDLIVLIRKLNLDDNTSDSESKRKSVILKVKEFIFVLLRKLNPDDNSSDSDNERQEMMREYSPLYDDNETYKEDDAHEQQPAETIVPPQFKSFDQLLLEVNPVYIAQKKEAEQKKREAERREAEENGFELLELEKPDMDSNKDIDNPHVHRTRDDDWLI